MSKFSELQSTHERLVNKAQTSEEILPEVQQYLKDIQSDSSQVSSTRERDQLRANLRFWASYVYEKTGAYPSVDLLPSTVLPQTDRRVLVFITGGLLVFLLLCATSYFGFVLPQQQTAQANGTAQTGFSTQNAQIATDRANLLKTPVLSTPAPETPSENPTEEAVPTSGQNVTSVQITSIKDGDQVKPVALISGTYSNLTPGSSIHLIVQPLSKAGLRFLMEQYALLSANSTSGEWTIEAKFGQGFDLEKQEDYVLSIAIAPDQDTRNKLLDIVNTGFQEYPSGVFSFPQKVVVSRPAYTVAIDGIQVIYSSFLDIEGNTEIFAMNPDGSKQHRITNTSGLNEMFPSLSPDGRQIAYVGRKNDENNNPVYSIEVINSDSTNRQEIVKSALDKGASLIYELPLWSNDGNYIAYAVGTPQSNGSSHWNIYVYDMQKQESFQVTEGEQITNRYFYWIPKTLDILFDAVTKETETNDFVRINIFNPKDEKIFFAAPGDQMQPALSSDGTKLAYMQLDNGAGNIYVVNLPDGKPIKVTKGQYQDEKPAWAPDNQTIFFESFEGGYRHIWSVKSDGTGLKQLTNGKDQFPFAGYMYAIIP